MLFLNGNTYNISPQLFSNDNNNIKMHSISKDNFHIPHTTINHKI